MHNLRRSLSQLHVLPGVFSKYLAPSAVSRFAALNFFKKKIIIGEFYGFFFAKDFVQKPGFLKDCQHLFVKSDGRAGSSVAPLSPLLSHLSVHGEHGGQACRQRYTSRSFFFLEMLLCLTIPKCGNFNRNTPRRTRTTLILSEKSWYGRWLCCVQVMEPFTI